MNINNKPVQMVELIRTTFETIGDGNSGNSPIRRLVKLYEPSGELVAQIDPAARIVTPETMQLMLETIKQRFPNDWNRIWDAVMVNL